MKLSEKAEIRARLRSLAGVLLESFEQRQVSPQAINYLKDIAREKFCENCGSTENVVNMRIHHYGNPDTCPKCVDIHHCESGWDSFFFACNICDKTTLDDDLCPHLKKFIEERTRCKEMEEKKGFLEELEEAFKEASEDEAERFANDYLRMKEHNRERRVTEDLDSEKEIGEEVADGLDEIVGGLEEQEKKEEKEKHDKELAQEEQERQENEPKESEFAKRDATEFKPTECKTKDCKNPAAQDCDGCCRVCWEAYDDEKRGHDAE